MLFEKKKINIFKNKKKVRRKASPWGFRLAAGAQIVKTAMAFVLFHRRGITVILAQKYETCFFYH